MLQQAAIAVDADADVHMPVATLAAGGLREDLEPPQPRQDPRRVGWVVASRTWRGGRYRRRGWRRCRAAADGAGRLGRRPTNRARARNLGRWQVHDRQHRQCGWRRWGRRRGRVRLHRRQRCDRRRVGLLLDVQGGVWRDWLVRGCLVPGWLRGRLGRRGGGSSSFGPISVAAGVAGSAGGATGASGGWSGGSSTRSTTTAGAGRSRWVDRSAVAGTSSARASACTTADVIHPDRLPWRRIPALSASPGRLGFAARPPTSARRNPRTSPATAPLHPAVLWLWCRR